MIKKTVLTFFLFFISGLVLHAEDAPQQFNGFNLDGYTNGGQKSWDIKGDTADILGNTVSLTNIVANAYGEEQMNLTAQNGTMDKESGAMHLEKDVVITTQTGNRLTTDSLDWERDKDLVKTNDPVTITNKDITATGTGIIAHPNLQTAQMNEDVTVKVNTDPDQPAGETVTITSDGPLEIDQSKQMAVFNDNVVAIQEGGRQLRADKIELFFDQANNQIKEMVCSGNVSISQGGNTTYSEKAIYKAADKRLILSGRPKLIIQMGEGLAPLGN